MFRKWPCATGFRTWACWVATDLSAGELTPAEATITNLGLEEQAHRVGLQKTAFKAALWVAGVLLACAVVLAGGTAWLYASRERFDWHAALLVAAFLIPGTVVTVTLLRAAFPKVSNKDEDLLPTLKLLKETAELLQPRR